MWIRIRCKAADPHPRSKKLAEKCFTKKFTWKNNDRKILDFLFAFNGFLKYVLPAIKNK